MSGQKTVQPNNFKVKGNMAPGELSNPQSITPYTTINTVVTLQVEVEIDGFTLVPVKMVADY